MAYEIGRVSPEVGEIKRTFQKRFLAMRFRDRSMEEAIDAVKTLRHDLVISYKKFFGGMGLSWVYNDREDAIKSSSKFFRQYAVTLLAHSGIHRFTNLFLKGRRAWPVVIHEIDPMNPLFLPPVNRFGNFPEVFPERCRLGREFILYLPTCPVCKEKFLWRIVKTSSPRDRYIYFDDRELYCANKQCSKYYKSVDMLVADVSLSNENDTQAFAKLFIDIREKRKKSWDDNPNKIPKPARWLRYWTRLGHVFHRDQGVYANDTAVEKSLERFNISPYNDLDNLKKEEANPYPNG